MSIESRCHQYGKIFDHWTIRRFLGSGSGGKSAVFQLVHATSDQYKSALKVISLIEERGVPEQLSATRKAEYEARKKACMENAEHEVLLMNGLQGRTNVVDYLDHAFLEWQDESGFGCDMLIRMELLSDLRGRLMTEEFFSQEDVLKIGIDICTALELCHSKRIIHRDIKPENIFYNSDGNYKLGDFGVSKILNVSSTSRASTGIGTPQYWAPEQPHGGYDKLVDIYSLGLVLYELSNGGRLPFSASSYASEEDVHKRMLGIPLPVPANASPELAAVILKACAFRPEDRYQSAGEFSNALRQIAAKYPVTVPDPPFRNGSGYMTQPAGEAVSGGYVTQPAGEAVSGGYVTQPAGEAIPGSYVTQPANEKPTEDPRRRREKTNTSVSKAIFAIRVVVATVAVILAIALLVFAVSVLKEAKQDEGKSGSETTSGTHSQADTTLPPQNTSEPAQTQEPSDIPADAFVFNGHSYYLYDVEQVRTGEEALAFCEEQGGYMAVISSQAENLALFAYIKSVGYSNAFFAYSDRAQEGTWKWIGPEASDYSNWHTGQPNEGKDANFAQFVERFADGSVSVTGEWSDSGFGGSAGYAFLCEWAPEDEAEVPVTEKTLPTSHPYYSCYDPSTESVLSDSAQRYYAPSELKNMTDQQLEVALAEITARHGQTPQNAQLADYFSYMSWFVPNSAEPELNAFEQANQLLISVVQRKRAGTLQTSGNKYLSFYKPGMDCYMDSSGRYLTGEDLDGLSHEEMILIRNEIFARRGYIFRFPELMEAFYCMDWYVPTHNDDSFSFSMFSEYDEANLNMINVFEEILSYKSPKSDNPYIPYLSGSQFIFPNSSSVYLTEDDLVGLSKEELILAESEIYARHGMTFEEDALLHYFLECGWYTPNVSPGKTQLLDLNSVENTNAALIRSYRSNQ